MKPSTRLTESIKAQPADSKLRTPQSKIRTELDWIVMKALEKDRGRRYQTANSFAHDIQRYLADEPVAAFSEPFAQRARRWGRKHPTMVTTTAAVAEGPAEPS